MSDVLRVLVIAGLVVAGSYAGIGINHVVVHFPARQRIGAQAYVEYMKASDLANGVAFYSVAGILSITFDVGGLVVGFGQDASRGLLLALALATASMVGVLATTIVTTPIIAELRSGPDEQDAGALLDRFVRIATGRAGLLMAQFGLLIWAVLEI